MDMRRYFTVGALCLILVCSLIGCDVQGGLLGILGGEQEGDQFGSVIGTDQDGNYIIQIEDGTFVVDDSEIIGGVNGDYVIIGGNGAKPNISITVVDPLAQVDAYEVTDFEVIEKPSDYVKITVAGMGEIVVRLYENFAPETVSNFKRLVEQDFYDGLVFHRIIQNFMIQGGGFDRYGEQKKTDAIKGEFAENGYKDNTLKHVRGVISMARTMVPDSATSQFFICDADSPHLDGSYAAFGVVVAGMETVDAIAAVDTDGNDAPLSDVVIESVEFVQPLKSK